MEMYQIESDTDLTRTRITSSKTLSALSGSDCAKIPQGIRYCDHLVEQVPLTVTWGLKFLVAYLEDIDRSSGERIRARAASVATVTLFSVLVNEFQLQSGGSFREFKIPINNSFCSIESTSLLPQFLSLTSTLSASANLSY